MEWYYIVLIILVGVSLLGLIVMGAIIGEGVSSRNAEELEISKEKSDDEEVNYLNEGISNLRKKVTKEYNIESVRGHKLQGYLVENNPNSNVYVLCIHGYKHQDGGFEFGRHSEIYLNKGYNVFLVDHQAHGRSEGKYISFGQYEHLDCLRWLKFMVKEFGEDIQIILQGQSMGACTTLLLAAHKDLPNNVKVVVADCGYTRFDKEMVHCAPVPKWLGNITIVFVNLYLTLFRKINLRKTDALKAVKNIKLPILIVHGNADDFVPTYMGHQLYEACGSSDKNLLIVEKAAHARSIVLDPISYDKEVTKLTDKYIK